MDQLPFEIYETIFNHLHLIDLARLKQVCKRLRSIVHDYRIRELVVSFADAPIGFFINADSGGFQNSCIIRPKNLKRIMPYLIHISSSQNSLFKPLNYYDSSPIVTFSTFNIFFLRSPSQFNVQFLKSLSCNYSDPPGSFDFNEINKLIHLERLEITFDRISTDRSNIHHGKLSLPNLKTLLLGMYEPYEFKMQVDAPKCEGFHWRSGGFKSPLYENGDSRREEYLQVSFANPNTVKYLSLDDYYESSFVFKNIELLQIASRADSIDEQLFAAFPRLKTLKIIKPPPLAELNKLFCLSREHEVKVSVCGIQLVDGRELDAFERNDLNDLNGLADGLIDNYDKLEDGLNFVKRIVYSERVDRLLEADAGRFYRIFDNVKQIWSKIKIERPALFLSFLTNYHSCLNDLRIINSGMPQQYFDQIANIQTLFSLCIEEETKIDLSFTFKLPVLSSLTTNHHVDLKEEIQLDKLEYLLVSVEKDEIRWNIYKLRSAFLDEGMCYKFEILKNKKGQGRPERRPQKSFEDLLRRYEEIKKEADSAGSTTG